MTTLTLGAEPVDLEVILVAGADFTSTLERDDDSPFAPGSTLVLRIYARGQDPVEWQAEINDDTARFNVPDDQVDAVIATRPSTAKLWLHDGEYEVVWASGKVRVVK